MQEIVIPLPITAPILWLIFGIIGCVFIFVSWMLVHHWNYYGIKDNHKVFVKSLYFIGGVGGLIIAALLISAYALT